MHDDSLQQTSHPSSENGTRQLNIRIPAELHCRLKQAAAGRGVTIHRVVTEAITKSLESDHAS